MQQFIQHTKESPEIADYSNEHKVEGLGLPSIKTGQTLWLCWLPGSTFLPSHDPFSDPSLTAYLGAYAQNYLIPCLSFRSVSFNVLMESMQNAFCRGFGLSASIWGRDRQATFWVKNPSVGLKKGSAQNAISSFSPLKSAWSISTLCCAQDFSICSSCISSHWLDSLLSAGHCQRKLVATFLVPRLVLMCLQGAK